MKVWRWWVDRCGRPVDARPLALVRIRVRLMWLAGAAMLATVGLAFGVEAMGPAPVLAGALGAVEVCVLPLLYARMATDAHWRLAGVVPGLYLIWQYALAPMTMPGTNGAVVGYVLVVFAAVAIGILGTLLEGWSAPPEAELSASS